MRQGLKKTGKQNEDIIVVTKSKSNQPKQELGLIKFKFK